MPFRVPDLPALALIAPGGITQGAATHLLQILYAAAAVLAVALIVVVTIAVVAWHRNKDTDLKP